MNKEDKTTYEDKRLLIGKTMRVRECAPHETHSKAGYYIIVDLKEEDKKTGQISYYEMYSLQRRIIYRWDANMAFIKIIIEKLKRGDKEKLCCLCHGVEYTLI